MKSNTNAVKDAVRKYILDNITLEDYEQENTPENVYNIFKRQKAADIKLYGEAQAFENWCRGVPGAFNASVYYEEIREILINEFKTNTPAKRDDEKSAKYYYYLLYRELKAMVEEPAKQSEKILSKIQKSFNK